MHRAVTGLVLNRPAWFAQPQFVAWLNAPDLRQMTWHRKGAPVDEWSDVIVLVDPSLSGAGTDSDMPEPMWAGIVAACRDAGLQGQREHIPVRLTNLEE